MVPTIHKQIIGLQMDRESSKALKKFSKELHEVCKNEKYNTEALTASTSRTKNGAFTENQSFIGMMFSMFKS